MIPYALDPSDLRAMAHAHAVACARHAAWKRAQKPPAPPEPARAEPAPAPKVRRPKSPRPVDLAKGTRQSGYGVVRDAILQYLADNGPATGEQIATALNLGKDNLRKCCLRLCNAGRLVHVVKGGPGIPNVYGLPNG